MKVHLLNGDTTGCVKPAGSMKTTSVIAEVTCGSCKRSMAYGDRKRNANPTESEKASIEVVKAILGPFDEAEVENPVPAKSKKEPIVLDETQPAGPWYLSDAGTWHKYADGVIALCGPWSQTLKRSPQGYAEPQLLEGGATKVCTFCKKAEARLATAA